MAISNKKDNDVVKLKPAKEGYTFVSDQTQPVEDQPDLVIGNEYLKKEQQKFFANQWVLQQNFQIRCGGADKIKLGDKEYSFKGVTKEQENEVKLRAFYFEKLNIAFNYDIGVLNLGFNVEQKDITKLKDTIKTLKQAMDQADEDFITYGAEIYFGIPKEIALKHFEEVAPYVLGRKYLNDIRVSGNRNDLPRLVRDLTERKYY